MPRSKEEFDKWFRENGGDPWDSGSAFVQDRLDNSLEFVKRHVPVTFGGTFIEIGAFNGDFTVRLASAFPNSHILANDISEVALDQARAKAANCPNVQFDLSDMAAFEPPIRLARPVVLVMLETLYYLTSDERKDVAQRLLRKLGHPLTFISAPIHENRYFQESVLRDIFESAALKCVDLKVLNFTDRFL